MGSETVFLVKLLSLEYKFCEKMELIKEGRYIKVYSSDNKIVKEYLFTGDEHDEYRRNCNIALKLYQLIPQYVPKVFEIVESKENIKLIMSKIEGITLYEYIRTERNLLDTLEVISCFKTAICAMHDAGYGHYDLHHRNVIVKEDRTVVLIDFDDADDVTIKAPDDTPLVESDHYDLKGYIASLIFTGLDNSHDVLTDAKKLTVEHILQYGKYPKTAQAAYDMFTQLPTTSYEDKYCTL